MIPLFWLTRPPQGYKSILPDLDAKMAWSISRRADLGQKMWMPPGTLIAEKHAARRKPTTPHGAVVKV